MSQIRPFPQVGMKIKIIWNHHPVNRFGYFWGGEVSLTFHHQLHSLKLTWPLEMMVSNRNLRFQRSIFRGENVSLGGGHFVWLESSWITLMKNGFVRLHGLTFFWSKKKHCPKETISRCGNLLEPWTTPFFAQPGFFHQQFFLGGGSEYVDIYTYIYILYIYIYIYTVYTYISWYMYENKYMYIYMCICINICVYIYPSKQNENPTLLDPSQYI